MHETHERTSGGTAFTLLVGTLAYIALHMLLPIAAWVTMGLMNPDLAWDVIRSDAAHPWWVITQLPRFAAGVFAGMIAATLQPVRRALVPALLFVLGWVANAFEQFPSNASSVLLSIWSVLPSVGIVVGFMLWTRRIAARARPA